MGKRYGFNRKEVFRNNFFFSGVELKEDAGERGVHFLAIFPPVIPQNGFEQRVDKTILKDSFDRICIQEPPQVLDYISQNKPRYIRLVSIKPVGTEPAFNERKSKYQFAGKQE